MSQVWILEYSPEQDAFQIQLAEDSIKESRAFFFADPTKGHGWMVLHVGTYRSCEAAMRVADLFLSQWKNVSEVPNKWTH